MRIHAIDTEYLKIPLGHARGGSGATEAEFVFVKVRLASGAEGTGFSYALTGGGKSIFSMIEDTFKETLLGTDLLEWDRVWYELWDKTHRLGRGVALPAISAIDIAIWDVRAKLRNIPLYQLFGAYRDKVPVYGSGRATHAMTTEQLIEGALQYREEGYDAIKLRVGALGLQADLRRVTAVREALSDSMRIMIDCNERLTYADALYLGRHLEELGIYWMEEPLISDDIEGHRRLAEHLNVAIATGEHLHGRYEFTEYMKQSAASILMPDVPLIGGFTEARRVATIAEVFGASVTPHFLPELHIHFAAATKNCIYIEHFPLISDILEEELIASEGYMIPPNRPGHGIKWDFEAIRHLASKSR